LNDGYCSWISTRVTTVSMKSRLLSHISLRRMGDSKRRGSHAFSRNWRQGDVKRAGYPMRRAFRARRGSNRGYAATAHDCPNAISQKITGYDF
jgi:hypothetical protein